MKLILFALPFLLLFSCTKKEDPIIQFTVIKDSFNRFVLTANLDKIKSSEVSVLGFSAGMSPTHYIQENQVKTEEITSNTVQLTMDSNNFMQGQTYYFTCFIGTKSGKLIRSAPIAFGSGISAPCSITNNTFDVVDFGGTGTIENGNTNNAVLTATSGGGVFYHYSVLFGSAIYKFIFRGNPTSQVYTTSTAASGMASNQVVIQNTSSGAIMNSGQDVYVKDNNDGTFTITKCPYENYDTYYFPSDVLVSFKITGNY
ncbi:MAG: hypothetical protein ACKOXP_00295 [Flavobacteriales bacterium]